MALAIASVLSNKKNKSRYVAMTGELTLLGKSFTNWWIKREANNLIKQKSKKVLILKKNYERDLEYSR